MPYMYILECADGSYYTGSTWNLEKRLWQYQNGEGANHTKKRLPVKLVYCEPYDRVEDAFRREKQIQGWSRRKKQALMERNPEKLIEYSRNYTQHGKDATASASTSSGSASPSAIASHDEPLPEPLPSTSSGSDGAFDRVTPSPELVEDEDGDSK